jgi:hypothetical protein
VDERGDPLMDMDIDGHGSFRIHSAFEPAERLTPVSKIAISRCFVDRLTSLE